MRLILYHNQASHLNPFCLAVLSTAQITATAPKPENPAPVRFHVKRREAKAPIGPRVARPDDTGREGWALALRALGIWPDMSAM
jgi:hypothetical protein